VWTRPYHFLKSLFKGHSDKWDDWKQSSEFQSASYSSYQSHRLEQMQASGRFLAFTVLTQPKADLLATAGLVRASLVRGGRSTAKLAYEA
jgi:hypothetical protein